MHAVDKMADLRADGAAFSDERLERKYAGILGEHYSFYRSFGSINGNVALFSQGRDSYFFTLVIKGEEAFIECAYAEARNNTNGAKVTAGVCGLNDILSHDLERLVQSYSNEWQALIYSFDTLNYIEKGEGGDFVLGKIGDVEVHDRYASVKDFENSSPVTYIKSPVGCHYFDSAVFLVFQKHTKRLSYLDVVESREPLKMTRLSNERVTEMAVGECW